MNILDEGKRKRGKEKERQREKNLVNKRGRKKERENGLVTDMWYEALVFILRLPVSISHFRLLLSKARNDLKVMTEARGWDC